MSSLDWSEILGWGPEKIEEMRLVAYSYIRQGHFEIAQTFFEALTVLDRTNPYDYKTLGAIFLQQNDPIRALQNLEKALHMDPNDPPTNINRVKALFMLGYREEGLRLAKELLKTMKDKAITDDAEALILAYE